MPSLSLQVSSAGLRGPNSPLNEDAVYYVAGAGEGQPGDQVARHGRLLAVSDGGGGPLAGPALQAVTHFYYAQMGRNAAENLRRAIHEANAHLGAGRAHAAVGGNVASGAAAETRDLRPPAESGAAAEPGAAATQTLAEPAPAPAALPTTAAESGRSTTPLPVRNPGATLAAAVVKDGLLYVANVGDSRVYLLREGLLYPLTRDQVDEHDLPTRQLGVSPFVEPDIFLPLALDEGDRLLICTDGLTDVLRNDEELALLAGKRPLAAAAADLVDAARAAGSADDISAIVAELQPSRLAGGLTRAQAAVLAMLAFAALFLMLWFLLELWLTIR